MILMPFINSFENHMPFSKLYHKMHFSDKLAVLLKGCKMINFWNKDEYRCFVNLQHLENVIFQTVSVAWSQIYASDE